MYSLFVYNDRKERIGNVTDIASLQWYEPFLGAGEVKLVASATSKNRELLLENNYLFNTERETIAIIKFKEINDDAKNPTITVRGLLTLSLFEDRVVMATEKITDAAVGMLIIAEKNLRGLDIEIPKNIDITCPLMTQITWGSVLDALQKLGESSGIGVRIAFDKYTNIQRLQIYKGTDRTSGDNYVGYFGDDIGTLTNIKITSDSANYKNIAVVAGQGTGTDRHVIQVGAAQSEDRREIYVDADDIAQTYSQAIDTGEKDTNGNPIFNYIDAAYTEVEYNELLTARGFEKLTENNRSIKVTADIKDIMLVYGQDYFLGDILPLKISKYGLRMTARVIGVNTIYEKNGRTVKAKLSNFDIIKEGYNL